MQFLAGLRKKLGSLFDNRDPDKTYWDVALQRRLEKLCSALQRSQKRNKEAHRLLSELLPLLQQLEWQYPDEKSSTLCRLRMVELTLIMLKALQVLGPAERYNYYKGTGYLVRRTEHSRRSLFADGEHRVLSMSEVEVALKYRASLWSALHFVNEQLLPIVSQREGDDRNNNNNNNNNDDDGGEGGRGKGDGKSGSSRVVMTEEADMEEEKRSAVVVEPKKQLMMQTSFAFVSFAAQIITVSAFRIPHVLQRIVSGLHISDDVLSSIWAQLELARSIAHKDDSPSVPKKKQLKVVGKHSQFELTRYTPRDVQQSALSYFLAEFEEELVPSAELQRQFPELFQWGEWNRVLDGQEAGNAPGLSSLEVERGQQAPWCAMLEPMSELYYLFVKHWLEHIEVVQELNGAPIEWTCVPGFRTLVRGLLVGFYYSLEHAELPGRTLKECSVAILRADARLLDYFVKLAFLKTNPYEYLSVLELLAQLEWWLKALHSKELRMHKSFDYEFFCLGLDRILQMEHHVCNSKLLNIIYNYADVFHDEARRAIFGSLLIQRWGYKLFLSWDSSARSAFYQILAFKVLRAPRSTVVPTDEPPMENEDLERVTDRVLLLQEESLVRNIAKQRANGLKQQQQQAEGEEAEDPLFDPHLLAYSEKALEEWDIWMGKYFEWEESGGPPPKLSMLQKSPKMKV